MCECILRTVLASVCLIGIFVNISRHLVKSAILLSILVTFTKTCLVTNKLRINVKNVFTFIVFSINFTN